MRHHLALMLGMLLLAPLHLPAAPVSAAAPVYRVVSFGALAYTQAHVTDINNAGQIVGDFLSAEGRTNAYMSVGRQLRSLGSFDGYSTSATGINNAGQVVGIYSGTRTFLFSDGQYRDLGTLGGGSAIPEAINDAGQIVGTTYARDRQPRAFLYADGRMSDLSAMAPAGRAISPYDINARGDIAGAWEVDGEPRAFLYADGQWSDLGTLGALNATARALNNAREVTGDAIAVDNRDVAFLWTAEKGMRELSRVSDGFVVGRDINNAGDVVGDGYRDHGPCCAFLARDGVARPLGEFLETGSDWSIHQAVAINDSGQIAGHGCSNTQGCMIVRLDPVPEPAVYAMLLAGLGVLLLARRRVTKVAWSLALLTGAIAATGPVAAASPPFYTVTPYQPINAEARATEMNDKAHLIGIFLKSGGPWYDDGVESPFLSDGRQFTDIGNVMLGFRPAGMNNADHLAGTAVLGAQRRNRAYLYRDGMVSNLGTLGGQDSGASAINDAGQIAGYSSIASGADHAFLYQDGIMRDIATLGNSSRATDINNRGQVTGNYTDTDGSARAFIYENGAMRDLGTLGGEIASATDIGSSGHILGTSVGANGQESSFIYHNGAMTALLTGGLAIRAFGINGRGDAVGSLLNVADRGAYLWSAGQLYDLRTLIAPDSGWHVYDAVAINDLGQIAATGCLRGGCSAVVLTPVPEPAEAAMLLAGLGLLGLLARRRDRLQR